MMRRESLVSVTTCESLFTSERLIGNSQDPELVPPLACFHWTSSGSKCERAELWQQLHEPDICGLPRGWTSCWGRQRAAAIYHSKQEERVQQLALNVISWRSSLSWPQQLHLWNMSRSAEICSAGTGSAPTHQSEHEEKTSDQLNQSERARTFIRAPSRRSLTLRHWTRCSFMAQTLPSSVCWLKLLKATSLVVSTLQEKRESWKQSEWFWLSHPLNLFLMSKHPKKQLQKN